MSGPRNGPSTGHTLRLATRGSAQATAQAQVVADALMAAHPGLTVTLVFVETLGDQRLDVPLHTMGGQGVFVKEVQRAVLRGDADFAAHSAKDLPSVVADGLQLAAFCERRDARDALVGARLDELAEGAPLATGSVRRRAQASVLRPDLQFVELRGNIITRLTKVPEGGALVMAIAALQMFDAHARGQHFDIVRSCGGGVGGMSRVEGSEAEQEANQGLVHGLEGGSSLTGCNHVCRRAKRKQGADSISTLSTEPWWTFSAGT